MFKRIVVGILTFTLAALSLCGCSFFSHDDERDMQQRIAHVASYKIVNSVTTDDGSTSNVEYTTEPADIYKRDLLEYVNSNANSLSSSFGTDLEGLYTYAATMLINVELITNEVNALIDCGKVEWGIKEQNTIKQNIYTVIDSTLMSIKNEILSSRDQEQIATDTTDDVNTETTYPIKPDASADDETGDSENVFDTEPWEPDLVRYPGLSGDQNTRSLEREAMRRFLALIETRVKNDFRVSSEMRAKFDKELKAIDNIINTKGIEYVYPVIGNYPLTDDSDFGYMLYYLSGESVERSQKISSLQEYLTTGINVDPSEVNARFTALQNEQRSQFDADAAAFDTAVNDSNTTVLYYPNNNYFYVKHILLPFSDDQTAALTAYKARPDIVNLQEKEKNEKVNRYRAQLADAIVCYPHKDGENDMTRPMSVDEVMSHVKSVMQPKESNVESADVAFDDLVYLYNTDPGAFGNNKGYIVKYKLGDGESETYMQEFADAARAMRDNISVGQVYYEKVITDYGVHIMYLASVTTPGDVALYGSTTPGRLQTYYDIFEQQIISAREAAVYNTWEGNVLSYNYNKHSQMFTDTFSNLWED